MVRFVSCSFSFLFVSFRFIFWVGSFRFFFYFSIRFGSFTVSCFFGSVRFVYRFRCHIFITVSVSIYNHPVPSIDTLSCVPSPNALELQKALDFNKKTRIKNKCSRHTVMVLPYFTLPLDARSHSSLFCRPFTANVHAHRAQVRKATCKA